MRQVFLLNLMVRMMLFKRNVNSLRVTLVAILQIGMPYCRPTLEDL